MLLRSTIFALLLVSSIAANAADVLDRVVATVNGHVILLSEWNDELRYECFMSGLKPEDVTALDQRAALGRLVDQQLLREQVRAGELKSIASDQVERQMEKVKAEVLRNSPNDSWTQLLAKYRLSEGFLKARIAAELQQLQLIDSRFRPSIQISQAEIEQYYKDQLVPRLPQSGTVNLPDVTPRIREILVQNKMDQMLNSWLESLRSQGQVKILVANSNAPDNLLQAGSQ